MLQSMSLPLDARTKAAYGGWAGVREDIASLGLDGVEGIWGGGEIDCPPALITGYHLTFFPDWLDYYRGDEAALCRKFGSRKAAAAFYGGENGRQTLLSLYRDDLARAAALGAQYAVFHVSDVSNEESCTYRWRHTNRAVIDAAAEVLNELLADRDPGFELLVENQWWPGFTFTDPDETAYLLERIRCPRKGILLDTGHLMNANPALVTEREGVAYIHQMLDAHGALVRHIRGVHLHRSLSGAYVRAHTGACPKDFPADPMEQFSYAYAHVLQIDRHEPWTDPAVTELIDRIRPAYLTHELAAKDRQSRYQAILRQKTTLEKGGRRPCQRS